MAEQGDVPPAGSQHVTGALAARDHSYMFYAAALMRIALPLPCSCLVCQIWPSGYMPYMLTSAHSQAARSNIVLN